MEIEEDAELLLNVLWPYESIENTQMLVKKLLDDLKVIVWCSFVISTHFFDKINRGTFPTVSVTSDRYTALLKSKVISQLHESMRSIHNICTGWSAFAHHWFFHDNLEFDIWTEPRSEPLCLHKCLQGFQICTLGYLGMRVLEVRRVQR